MRRFLAMGFLALALTLGAASTALGAPLSRDVAVSSHGGTPAVAVTTLKWKATFSKGAISGRALLSIASTYKTGRLAISATGVKKGDHLVASLRFRTKKGKTGTIVTAMRTVTGSTGKVNFSFALSKAVLAAIKADLKAGDKLTIRFADGTVVTTGTFMKA